MMKIIQNVHSRFLFTQENLETNLSFYDHHYKVAPSLFNNIEFKTLKVKLLDNKPFRIIDADEINRADIGTIQAIRNNGLNSEYKKLKSDIVENGVRLDKLPIVVELNSKTGRYQIIDGVTKDLIYQNIGIKNRIVMVVEIDTKERNTYGNRLNAGELWATPGGLISEDDIIKNIANMADNDLFDEGISDKTIRKEIDKMLGSSSKFSGTKKNALAWLCYWQYQDRQGGDNPHVFEDDKAVKAWLNSKNYIDTDEVVYVPYAAASSKKAVIGLAQIAEQNPNKKIRLVVYVGKFDSQDLKQKYISSLEKFKKEYYDYITNIGQQYFGVGAISKNSSVELYGFVPAGLVDVCPDMEKLIKPNKLMTLQSYQNNKLSNALSIDDEEDEDEDEDVFENAA